MGKYALSSSSLPAGKQRRPSRASAALGRRPWASGLAGVRGKRGRVVPGTDSQPQLGQGRSRVTWPRWPAAMGGDGARPAFQRRGGEQ